MMWEDPIVAEIHKIRAELLAEFNGDVDAYHRHIQQVAEEKRKRGVVYVDPTVEASHADPRVA